MIDQAEFSRRRRQLMRTVGEGSLIVVPGSQIQLRNGDVEFPFRQHSDLFYLTGFPEPNALLVLAPGRKEGEAVLFCRQKSAKEELWHGAMAGLKGATADYAMDDAFPIADLDDILPNLMEGFDRLYYPLGRETAFDQRVMEWISASRRRKGARPPEEFISLDHHLHDMRLYKSAGEIRSMTRSAKIAVGAHVDALSICRPGLTEYQLRAELLKTFHYNNASASYAPIVAGGSNGCVLHYTRCEDVLKDGDLVLIDAGAEYDHYASDITRTFPVNGRFTPEQRAVYDIVLEAELAAIDAAQVGNSWLAPHDAAVRVISRGLIRLKLLEGRLDSVIRKRAYERFFMHKTGHWLGMDVHDVGDYEVHGEPRELEAGMAFTIEPGIYIDGKRDIPKAFRNMGIRIEDSLVLRKSGPQVLSAGAPKTAKDIEAAMA
ncbi:MAG: aminopeptidase P N-terminal domain-containing protein [Lysobacterales bacterium]